MKIGIDISQLAYLNTGVANYLKQFVLSLVAQDKTNEYVLFFSSLRKSLNNEFLETAKKNPNVTVKTFRLPQSLLHILWNVFHVLPVHLFISKTDIFITSDWTEPPVSWGKKATIIYDLIVYKYPEELASRIVNVQKRKLKWVKKESDRIFCISESTKKDVAQLLEISENKLKVIHPGVIW